MVKCAKEQVSANGKMEQDTKATGLRTSDMEMDFSFLKIKPSTKVSGAMTRSMV